MIARIAAVAVILAGATGGFLALRGSGERPPTYRIVVDNAFGLIEGADVKAAGVRVGKVADLDVVPSTYRAVVTAEIDRPDFGDFRRDVFCSVEPQSLIGEYFLNCDPGTARRVLPEGSTIPVEQTATTVPPDLVNNIMRRPYRERFGIILDELGRGLATRGPELQQVIRRAIPALRQTDRVLRIFAQNRRTLQSLTREADVVLVRLAENREDVARFVSEARDTAAASADRRVDLRENIRLLPPFLRRLRPVLRDLGTAARRQAPALRDLRLAAPDLERLLERLGPFANASVPAVRSLGEASVTGRSAMRSANATVAELRELAALAEDPASNLRFVLEHLDDRRNAVERNPLSPGGEGFTGLEAFLQYPFVQSQAINVFDRRGYLLKLNLLATECSAYRDESVRDDPGLRRRCSAALGPSAPGIDPGGANRAAARDSGGRNRSKSASPPSRGGSPPRDGAAGGEAPRPAAPRGDGGGRTGLLDDLLDGLGRLPRVTEIPGSRVAPKPPASALNREDAVLLDYLLGP